MYLGDMVAIVNLRNRVVALENDNEVDVLNG
jgi:hypothetical protein